MDELLLSRLRERDSLQVVPFEGLIESVNEYKGRLESCLLTLESLKFKRLHRSSLSADSLPSESPPSASASLQQKLLQLKEERAELYKQQGLHATQVLSLNDQLRAKDAALNQLQLKLTEAEERCKAEQMGAEEAKRRFKEKEMEARAIGDELVALHLEMLRLDAQGGKGDGSSNGSSSSGNSGNTANGITATSIADSPISPECTTCNPIQSNMASTPLMSVCSLPQLSVSCEKELIAPHQYPITASASVPSKRLLLTGSEDQKIILYDLTRVSTRAVLKWSSINGAIVALAAGGGDGSGVVASCAAYDQEVTLWSAESGRVIGTLPYKSDENSQILLKFADAGRLWMAQGGMIRLWDTGRMMLLRSWQLSSEIKELMPDSSRPDRAWFFGADGAWGLVNGITGKVDKQGCLTEAFKLISCGKEAFLILTADEKRMIGFNYAFEGLFEVELGSGVIECIALHPSRADLIAVAHSGGLEIIKISADNWAPQRAQVPGEGIGALQWGPEELDPISREAVWKLVAIAEESRAMKLFSIK